MVHGLDLFSTSLFFAFSPSAPPPSPDKRSLLTIDDEWIVPGVSALLPLFCQLGQRQPSMNQKCCLNIYPQMSGMVLSDNIYIWMSPNTLEMITPWLQPHILSRILPWFFFPWVFIFWTPNWEESKTNHHRHSLVSSDTHLTKTELQMLSLKLHLETAPYTISLALEIKSLGWQ